MTFPRLVVTEAVRLALAEDLGRGDITTSACVAADAMGSARMIAREPLVLAGLATAHEAFMQVDPALAVQLHAADGARLSAGGLVLTVQGAAQSILMAERVALNFVQRLSGVATLTRSFVDALPVNSQTRITDTRKTTPGLRLLERAAVRAGGGHNHREDLGAAVLIKDNHIAASGSVRTAIERARAYAPHTSKITCEVDTLAQLDEALSAGADCILLDNFSDADVATAVRVTNRRAILEVSGGVRRERISTLAALGVDVISIGALTHSANAVDLGLDWGAA